MSVRGPSNVGRAVQTAIQPFCARFSDHGTKEMLGVVGWKVWRVSNFAQQHATTYNNMSQGVQTDAKCNIQQCWELLANNVASVRTGLKRWSHCHSINFDNAFVVRICQKELCTLRVDFSINLSSSLWSLRLARNIAKQKNSWYMRRFLWKTDDLMENAWRKRSPHSSTHREALRCFSFLL